LLERFAVFTSGTQAEPIDLNGSAESSSMSGSFAVNSWLLIQSDWKKLHSQFQIHQTLRDPNTHREISGTSTIENTLEAI